MKSIKNMGEIMKKIAINIKYIEAEMVIEYKVGGERY